MNNSIKFGIQSQNKVVYVATSSISPSLQTEFIYQMPENYESIKENIRRMGILTPLIVNTESKVIISGNLRHQIAIELSIDEVPVIFEKIKDDEALSVSISTNQYRKKSTLEILEEMKYFNGLFIVGKGRRTDLNPEMKELKKKRDEMLKEVSKDKQNKLKAIDRIASELYGHNSKEYQDVFNKMDDGTISLNKTFKNLDVKLKLERNNNIVPKEKNISLLQAKVYNKSSIDMSELEDESVQTAVVSPPYFQMFDYHTGKGQLGLESNVDEYLNNLLSVFREVKRVLKSKGSLFVNLNDCVKNGLYQAVPQRFVLMMLELNFMLVDEWAWIKKNPTYSHGKSSVRNHEPIFHFVKSKDYHYDVSWMNELVDVNNAVSFGTNAECPKIFSGLDYFLEGVIRCNASSTSGLRKECGKEGFYLTHSATFPLCIPSICILTTSQIGDTVLDCFNGTGTTGEASIVSGRKYVGYETNPEYVMASEVRFKTYFKNIINYSIAA
jgi:site-specific DNA-methyltransferase (adenine-specific)